VSRMSEAEVSEELWLQSAVCVVCGEDAWTSIDGAGWGVAAVAVCRDHPRGEEEPEEE
jgi:hypothetical protein